MVLGAVGWIQLTDQSHANLGVYLTLAAIIKGNMKSNTAKKLIQEWALLYREELQANWNKAVQGEQIDRIAPLN